MKKNRYNIGDKIFFNKADSREGLIIDMAFYYKDNGYEYLVSVDFGERYWLVEEEISSDKIF